MCQNVVPEVFGDKGVNISLNYYNTFGNYEEDEISVLTLEVVQNCMIKLEKNSPC